MTTKNAFVSFKILDLQEDKNCIDISNNLPLITVCDLEQEIKPLTISTERYYKYIFTSFDSNNKNNKIFFFLKNDQKQELQSFLSYFINNELKNELKKVEEKRYDFIQTGIYTERERIRNTRWYTRLFNRF